MPVFRVIKNTGYTTMSNRHLRDKSLSLKGKGLLSMLLSLPDEWRYSVNGLTAICKEGRSSVLSTLQELERSGYVNRRQTRDASGHMSGSEYDIYETPEDNPQRKSPQSRKPQSGNPTTDNPTAEKPTTDNPPQLITDESKKEESITDRMGEAPPHRCYGRYKNVLLSDEDLGRLKAEFPLDWQRRIDRLSEYMASTGKTYRNHLATIESWASRDDEKRKKPDYRAKYYQFKEGDSL
jgi:hypothetical protein